MPLSPFFVSLLGLSVSAVIVAASQPPSTPRFVKYHETARSIGGNGSPRRPLPVEPLPIFYERAGVAGRARQGTTFVVDARGTWATAAHVTDHCAAVRFVVDQRITPAVARPVVELGEDISLITDGEHSATALLIARGTPRPGATGYHMGFPMGAPGMVGTRLLGTTSAVRHAGRTDTILPWLEDWRTRETIDQLDGLSGGPVLNELGQVVGIVSMASERRGRILTSLPVAVRRWLSAEDGRSNDRYAAPITNRAAAITRLQFLINHGFIRQLYCDALPLP